MVLKHRIAREEHTDPAKITPQVPSARHSVPSAKGMTRQIPSKPTTTPLTIDTKQTKKDVLLIFVTCSLVCCASSSPFVIVSVVLKGATSRRLSNPLSTDWLCLKRSWIRKF